MVDLDVETFFVTLPEVLDRAEDELALILIVGIPLRTTDIGAKKVQ